MSEAAAYLDQEALSGVDVGGVAGGVIEGAGQQVLVSNQRGHRWKGRRGAGRRRRRKRPPTSRRPRPTPHHNGGCGWPYSLVLVAVRSGGGGGSGSVGGIGFGSRAQVVQCLVSGEEQQPRSLTHIFLDFTHH